jgi:glutamyl-tRNA synthetase
MSYPILLRPQLTLYTCRSCAIRLSRRWHSNSPLKGLQSKSPKATLPDHPARTRFAPSPTGYLHLGSLRTALFNYLLAKRTGGQFLLRIEDTDQKRTVPDAEARLLQDLRWAGLQWDEGPEVGGPYGPYKQSERTALYREHAQQLLDNGHAYRCFCSTERLNALAEQRHKLGLATDYDRTCASIPSSESHERAEKGQKFVVRLKVPDEYSGYHDLIYGTFKPLKRLRGDTAYEDPILLKSDGLPTYHLANVIDDHHMAITHVIRGSEWMPSTPKHIALYSAFNWTPPQFAHVGLLVDEQGNKLSKRNFDTDIAAFKEMEIFPETLTNFAALLGWSHKERSDVMDLETLTKHFNMKFTKGNTTVTFGKLHFLQRKHALERAKKGGKLLQEMVMDCMRLLEDTEGPYQEWRKNPLQGHSSSKAQQLVKQIIQADAENYTNANEFLYRHAYFFSPPSPPSFPPTSSSHQSPTSAVSEPDTSVPSLCKTLATTTPWTKESLRQKTEELIDSRPEGKKGAKDVYHYLRVALTGREQGMRIYDVMEILGQEEVARRLGVEGEV